MALGFVALLVLGGAAKAATVVNLDGESRTIVVTEGGDRNEVLIGAGQSAEVCVDGCFITFPNGDREALTGSEAVEISGGAGHIR